MFGTKTKEVEINGVTYTIQKFSAWEGGEIAVDLQKQILPILAEIVGGGENGISNAVYAISAALDKATFNDITNKLLFNDNIYFQKDGNDKIKLTTANRDMAFEEVDDILELIVEVVNLNFKNFIANLMTRFTK